MSALTEAQKKACDAFASATKSALSTVLNSLAPTQNADYPKPHVQEAPSDSLDPLLGNPSGVLVEVVYPSMRLSDFIGLSFNGNDTFEVKNGSLFGKVTFLVPVADVTLAVGKTIQVIYAVVRPDGVILSEILNLIVQPIAADKLPTPQITQASEDVLDLTTFGGDADVTVEAWPLIAVGQTVWLTVSGPSGGPTMELLKAYVVTAADVSKGVRGTIARAELEKFTVGSELRVWVTVGFDRGGDEGEAIKFPNPVYTIEDFILFEAFNAANQDLLVGQSIGFPTMVLTARAGNVFIRDAGFFTLPPWITGSAITLGSPSSVLLTLNKPARKVRFGAFKSLIYTVSYFDEGGSLIWSHVSQQLESRIWFEYASSPDRKIKSISVVTGDNSSTFIDNFSMTQ
ncbi:hypothetical protein ACVBEG_22155 [Pseudomonas sp. GG8]